MSTLIASIANTSLKVRWQEPYVSEALNVAHSSVGKGIVHGFTPTAPGGKVLRLRKHPILDQSVAAYFDAAQGLVVMYVEAANLDLDLTPFIGTTVIIGLTVSYTVGFATSGEIRAYTQAEHDAAPTAALWACLVNVPAGAAPIALTDIILYPRDEVWLSRDDQAVVGWGENSPDPYIWSAEKWLQSAQTGNAITTIQSATVNKGPNAIRALLSGGATPGNAYRIMRSVLRVESGDSVRVQFDARGVALAATQRGAKIDWYTSAFALISTSNITPALLTGSVAFATYTASVKAPATTRYAIVSFGVTNLTAGEMFLDAAFVSVDRQNRFQFGAAPFAEVQHTDAVFIQNLKSVLNQMNIQWSATIPTEFEFVPNVNGTYTLLLGLELRRINVTLEGTLTVEDDVDINGDLEASDVNFTGTLDVAGATVINDTLDVNGDTAIVGEVDITGTALNFSSVTGDMEMTGQVKADNLEFNAVTALVKRYTFEGFDGGQWISPSVGTSVPRVPGPAGNAWQIMRVLATSAIGGVHRLPDLPKNAIITEIKVGINDNVDAGFDWRLNLVERATLTSVDTTLDTSGALVRSGATVIQTLTWTLGTPYTIVGAGEVLLLEHENWGTILHDVYWVLVTYTVARVKEALGLN